MLALSIVKEIEIQKKKKTKQNKKQNKKNVQQTNYIFILILIWTIIMCIFLIF